MTCTSRVDVERYRALERRARGLVSLATGPTRGSTQREVIGGRALQMDDAAADGDADDRRAVVDAQLRQYVLHVHLGRLLADAERDGNLLVAHPVRDESHDLNLAGRQRGLLAPALQPGFHLRRQ